MFEKNIRLSQIKKGGSEKKDWEVVSEDGENLYSLSKTMSPAQAEEALKFAQYSEKLARLEGERAIADLERKYKRSASALRKEISGLKKQTEED